MSFIYNTQDGFILNQEEHILYKDKYPKGINYLFSDPKENILNLNKKDVFVFEDSYSSSEDNFDLIGGNNIMDIINNNSSDDEVFENYGGKKKTNSRTKHISKSASFKTKTKSGNVYKVFLKVMPTFVNVVKGRMLYNNKTKLHLEPFGSKDKEIILGTIIDLKKLQEHFNKDILTKDDIENYVMNFDVVPLMFNFNEKNITYKNKKNSFFSTNSKLMFITFKITEKMNYYYESIIDNPYTEFMDINDILSDKNYIIAHYIYENYYMFISNPKNLLKLNRCYFIDADITNDKKLLSEINLNNNIKFEPNNKKISLNQITHILDICNKHLSVFK